MQLINSLKFVLCFSPLLLSVPSGRVVGLIFFGKSGRSLHQWITTRLTGRSPVTLPPGLGISTSGLNFADSKITATVTDGICKAIQDITVSGDGYKCTGMSRHI